MQRSKATHRSYPGCTGYAAYKRKNRPRLQP
nr:MAG TPA: Membrane-anchored junction protein [Caudoviricetes sp.]